MTQEDMIYQLTETLENLLQQQSKEELHRVCHDQRPADLTEALDLMDLEQQQAIFQILEVDQAAEVLGECDEDLQRDLMASLSDESLARVMESLPLDEATDAISELTEEQAFSVLAKINPPESQEIRDLMRYSEDSAGGIMTPDVIGLSRNNDCG